MTITKRLTDLSPRPKLRLAEIERQLKKHRIITPIPSRRALIIMCQEGTLETATREEGSPWLVYEDSFVKWIKTLDDDR